MNKNRNEKGQLLKGNGRRGRGESRYQLETREEKEGRTNRSRRVSKGRA